MCVFFFYLFLLCEHMEFVTWDKQQIALFFQSDVFIRLQVISGFILLPFPIYYAIRFVCYTDCRNVAVSISAHMYLVLFSAAAAISLVSFGRRRRRLLSKHRSHVVFKRHGLFALSVPIARAHMYLLSMLQLLQPLRCENVLFMDFFQTPFMRKLKGT